MNIALLDYYREVKNYTYDKISELSGVPIETVQRIFRGEERSLDYEALQAIEAVLKPEKYPDMVWELQTAYYAGKDMYTVEDYYALPEEQRVELIDGAFYDMGAPTTGHQTAAAQIFIQIQDYIDKKKGRCRAFYAPVDVQLDCDDRTIVQPDVLIVCDKDKITEKCIVGAPDFIIEVLSKTTEKKDMYIKFHKYRTAGVREYWMVDIKRRKVIVYFFENSLQPMIYGMNDEVPVGIYDEKLTIDFVKVEKELEDIGQ